MQKLILNPSLVLISLNMEAIWNHLISTGELSLSIRAVFQYKLDQSQADISETKVSSGFS